MYGRRDFWTWIDALRNVHRKWCTNAACYIVGLLHSSVSSNYFSSLVEQFLLNVKQVLPHTSRQTLRNNIYSTFGRIVLPNSKNRLTKPWNKCIRRSWSIEFSLNIFLCVTKRIWVFCAFKHTIIQNTIKLISNLIVNIFSKYFNSSAGI